MAFDFVAWLLIVIDFSPYCRLALFFGGYNCLPYDVCFIFPVSPTPQSVSGDIALPKEWQLFGPLEGLTGILMRRALDGILLRHSEQNILNYMLVRK